MVFHGVGEGDCRFLRNISPVFLVQGVGLFLFLLVLGRYCERRWFSSGAIMAMSMTGVTMSISMLILRTLIPQLWPIRIMGSCRVLNYLELLMQSMEHPEARNWQEPNAQATPWPEPHTSNLKASSTWNLEPAKP